MGPCSSHVYLPTQLRRVEGSSEGREDRVRTRGRTGGGGGEDVMEYSISMRRLVFTAKFPSIDGENE
jgi:hypothetical protein